MVMGRAWASLVATAAVAAALLGGVARASDVQELTAQNFDARMAEGDWLLEFYAPWCGHCRNLAPTYEKVATALKGKVLVGKVDGPAQSALLARFPVRGFPTLFSVRDGKVREFNGRSRSEQALEAFAVSDEGEPLSVFSSPLGPIGRAKGWLVATGTTTIGYHERLQKEYNLSATAAWGVLSLAGVCATLALFAFILFLFPGQATGPRPHAD